MKHLEIHATQIENAETFAAAVTSYIAAMEAHRFDKAGAAAPTAHHLVERAVFRLQTPDKPDQFFSNYKIVGDTLDERKARLAAKLEAEAQKIIEKINPPLKRRLVHMLNTRAMVTPPGERTAEHEAAIAANEETNKRTEAVIFHLAQIEAEIHDLTEETIKTYTAPAFPS